MTDDTGSPERSPYAVPYNRFLGDADTEHAELVVEQPHDTPAEGPGVGGTDGGDD